MLSIFFLKILIFFLRTFTSNSATALPGLVMERYFPKQLKRFLEQFDKVVFITGTNGKTTTSRILGYLLKQNDILYVSNASGSNLIRGIASELIDRSNYSGKIDAKVAVFEVEEATYPKLVKFLKPHIVVVTNIFRDQLDAYGEIDKTYQYIKDGIENSNNPVLILNKNDQRVESLESSSKGIINFISYDPQYLELIKLENRDAIASIENIAESKYKEYQITNIHIDDDLHTHFDLLLDNEKVLDNCELQVPGYHNTFNAVAGMLAAQAVTGNDIVSMNLEDFEPAFGRGETVTYKNTTFQLLLGKNPAGLNLNFKLLESVKRREAILLMLNDNTADGKDVSWIWDCDFSILKKLNFENVFIGGTRRYDMALRVKYEGIPLGIDESGESHIYETIGEAVDDLASKNFEKVFVLPTYTAMLQLRKELNKRTNVKNMYD